VVLFNGQPLANADIAATYDYYNYKTANAYAQTQKTHVFLQGIGLELPLRITETRQTLET
jgi:hypothetical protein